ncbi:MAG TPA: ABC transporter substrate-binding protein, partial [Candidatus Polarisedimenticolaceae bacterium]|nr:ABC transporter substrate-binding protein [Candidatus Polarisedimenticolaceae bacterium]
SRPAAEGAPPQHGGTAVLGSLSDVDSWNEYLSAQDATVNLLRRIYLRLAQEGSDERDGPRGYTPLLAASWESSADGLSWTFRLREASWSDGTPLTARDVRFTWQAQISSDVPWVGAASKAQISDVEAVDARTVRFHFKRRYPYQLADAVEGGILPEHVFGRVPFAEWARHDWSTVHVGSGPFVLESYRPGEELTLARNPRYFGGDTPHLERVVVRIVPDMTNLVTQLRAGQLDYLEGIPPREAAGLRQQPTLHLAAFDYPKADALGWNAARPPLDDPAVRRALTLAIDRNALVENLLHGFGRVSRGPVPSFWWLAARELAPLPYDPDQARRLLAGRTPKLELLTNAGNRQREEVLVQVQAQLAQVGVRVEVRPLEMRAMRARVAAGDYDGYLGGWVFSGKIDLRAIFGSASRPPAGLNVVGYRSAEVDRLLDAADAAADWPALKAAFDALQQRIDADQPYTFLYETQRVAAWGPRLAGVAIDVPSDPLAGLERFSLR